MGGVSEGHSWGPNHSDRGLLDTVNDDECAPETERSMAQPLPANFPVAQFDQHAERGESSFRRAGQDRGVWQRLPSTLSSTRLVMSAWLGKQQRSSRNGPVPVLQLGGVWAVKAALWSIAV